MPTIDEVINSIGISAFGLAMPVLSPRWTAEGTPTAEDADISLRLRSGEWICPASGILRIIMDDKPMGLTLVRSDGTPATGPGRLLTLFPQVYLRLARLYAHVLESSGSGTPVRPVPRYFLYSGSVDATEEGGNVWPGDSIGQAESLTIYDDYGMPIDPLAVAAAFSALMDAHHVLQHRDISTSFNENSQLSDIANPAATEPVVRVRLSDHAGRPYSGNNLEGLTALSTGQGLFTLDRGMAGSITLSPAGDGFTDEDRRLLLIGPATTGRLGDVFHPAALPSGISLGRDFFSVRVVQLRPFLLGDPNTEFNGARIERRPAIRTGEILNLLADGNDVLAACNAALSGETQESLCVAQAIRGDFNVPASPGEGAHWPDFPPLDGQPAELGPLAIGLKDSFSPEAAYTGNDGVDVALALSGLPAGAAVRVYPRKFTEDAREVRGDGAGGVTTVEGRLSLVLPDPFSLRKPGPGEISIPSRPTLRFDVAMVKRTGEARIYGDVRKVVEGSSTQETMPAGRNPFSSASRRGVCNAGILGLAANQPALSISDLLDDFVSAARALSNDDSGETERDAPRMPTMARRDLLVAGRSSGAWRAVIAGGRLTPETHSADARLGSPGGLGGRETQVVGISTQGGRLAYDLARMAFRRTTGIITRLADLAGDDWEIPDQPTGSGTFAGAVLQTVAPFCETPELGLLKDVVDERIGSFPDTFDELVDMITSNASSGSQLNQLIGGLGSLNRGGTLDRPFEELHREVTAACYGRRDTQWALTNAFSSARRFIYIESPGVASTKGDYGLDDNGEERVPPYAIDLFELMASRLDQALGLHIILCIPKHAWMGAGYEPLAAWEVEDRKNLITGLPDDRIVSFHPIGFPGRPSQLESTVVIVDDVWALVGSSTFRRRGLTFDGSSDLVFTDTNLVKGRSPAISDFRRHLLAERLGIPDSSGSPFGTMPDPSFVRLSDGVESFYVIREMLMAGGLGKIDRLWKGQVPSADTDPSMDIFNPEGQEINLTGLLQLSAIGDLNAF